jgi:hypothetical protein
MMNSPCVAWLRSRILPILGATFGSFSTFILPVTSFSVLPSIVGTPVVSSDEPVGALLIDAQYLHVVEELYIASYGGEYSLILIFFIAGIL